MAIRNDGDWEGWLKFFLRGTDEVSREATETARAILDLREEHRQAITTKLGGSPNGLQLLDILFGQPIITIGTVEQRLKCVYVTASRLVDQFVRLGLLKEITGFQRNRRFRYEPYLALFEPQEDRRQQAIGRTDQT
jgi:Fic family protein